MAVVLALSLAALSTSASASPTRCNPERLPASSISADGVARPPPPPGKAKLQLLAQVQGEEKTWPASLDGSPYGFYHYGPSASPPASNTRWTIYLQGGGWCYDEVDCLCRSKSSMGSSTKLPPTWSAQTDCLNPLTDGTADANCNYIGMPYLDGASFSGHRDAPWPVPGSTTNETLMFRGLANLDATLDYAFEHLGLDKATEVVLTGVSAGGLATYLHADRVAAAIRRRAAAGVRVTALPKIGFFLDYDNFNHTNGYPGGPNTPQWALPHSSTGAANYSMWMKNVYQMQNVTFGEDGALSPACLAKHQDDPHLCFMAPHMVETIQTPLFILNSRFDEWQLVNILQSTWETKTQMAGVLAYGQAFLDQFQPVLDSNIHGSIIGTCICHCTPSTAVRTNSTAPIPFAELYADWYYGKTNGGIESMYIERLLPNANGTDGTRTGNPRGSCYSFPGCNSQAQPWCSAV